MNLTARLLLPFAFGYLLYAPISLQAESFPPPFNTDPAGKSGPIPAAEAAAAFTLPDGFTATVFASEPDVQNPIAMAWDASGRMWVAENYTYGSSKVRFQMGLRDRVLVFEDTDHDGKADKRTVFTDNVQMLTSVEVGRGGIWLMCPPQLLFIPDQNGDLVPDGDPEVILDGFTVGKGNYHNFANGLRWGPDGWLYGRCGHSCPGRLGIPATAAPPTPRNGSVPLPPKANTPARSGTPTTAAAPRNGSVPLPPKANTPARSGTPTTAAAPRNGRVPLPPEANAPARPGTPDDARVPIKGGIWRYHPGRKTVEVLAHGTVNPWGHDWAQHGELFFINTVIGHLWHMIPGAHYKESGSAGSPNPRVYDRLDHHADHYHYDTGQPWSKSRDGAANDYGGGHSHIGMTIYQADHLPEYWQNKLLTWNQHGRRANVERLRRHGSGYLAEREPDAFLSGDTWFRGIDIRTGPDGALYALDWSDTGECHEHTGVHRTSGRIYKITHGEPAVPDLSPLTRIWPNTPTGTDPATVAAIIRHPNVWHYRRWQETLSDKSSKSPPAQLLTALNEILTKDPLTKHRLRALWALNALQRLDPASLLTLLDDPDEHLRTWSIRLLTDHSPLDTIHGPIKSRPQHVTPAIESKFASLATSDPSPLVRLALASALQRLPLKSRPNIATALASHAADADDHNLPSLVWFGIIPLFDTAPAGLLKIAQSTTWPDLLRWTSRALGNRIAETPESVESILELAAAAPKEKAPSILTGLTEAFKGWRTAPKPNNWDKVATALGESESTRKLATLFGDTIALDQLKTIALDNKSPLGARQSALHTLIEKRPPDLRQLCERLLTTRRLNTVAVRGLAPFDDPAIAAHLIKNYQPHFQPTERPPVIDVLTTRPTWSAQLLAAIESKKIPRTALTPYHARQIQSFGDDPLTAQLQKTWGRVTKTDATKAAQLAELKKTLTPEYLATADLTKGRILYQNICASCHKLHGEGGTLGPDLTGSGRADLTYLLENILTPSAVVSAEYTMTSLKLNDGRTLTGVIPTETVRTLTLRMPTEDATIEKSQITTRETLPQSIMPEGLFDALGEESSRDLLAYLMHPRQAPLPK